MKDMTAQIKNVGKLLPMLIVVDSEEKTNDVMKIVEYKMALK